MADVPAIDWLTVLEEWLQAVQDQTCVEPVLPTAILQSSAVILHRCCVDVSVDKWMGGLMDGPTDGLKKCFGAWALSHRVVSLADANEEDELREEERCHQILVDVVEVGSHLANGSQ